MTAGILPEVKRSLTPPVRILVVVEDERIVALSLRNQLLTLSYKVVGQASSGDEGRGG
jgi:hypothetical protein